MARATPQPQTKTQTQMSLKLVVDKKEKRILYAEADKKFVDFLFAILTLPLGAVVKHVSASQLGMPMVTWSLGQLFRSVETLNISYFEPYYVSKDILVNPKLPSATKSHLGNLMQVESSSPPTTYYSCGNSTIRCHSFSATCGAICPKCFKPMTTTATYVYGANEARPPAEGGYVRGGLVTYMVMGDLTVKPISSSMSTISVLNQLRVVDIGQIEEKLIYLDINEGVKLLRASLHTSAVLTYVFLHKIDFPKTPGRKRQKVLGRIIKDDEAYSEEDDRPIILRKKPVTL